MSTTEIALLLAGLLAGGLIAWFWAVGRTRGGMAAELAALQERAGTSDGAAGALRQQLEDRHSEIESLRVTLADEQQARIKAQTELTASLKSIEDQKKMLAETEKRFREAFASLSLDALRKNNKVFSQQAEQQVKPLRDALDRFEKQNREMEKSRQTAYGVVKEQVQAMRATHEKLQKETANLSNALRAPQVRGRWGEITLRRVVEVAGMSSHCDFLEQPSVDTDEGRLRPDMVVTLPGARAIVVDSKAPLNAYLSAVETTDAGPREKLLASHAHAIRGHMQSLSGKAYWNQFETTPDFVVMFLPGESFFSAALEQDRTLIEDGIDARVILATPTTLIALLRTVAYGWQQQQVTENARQIAGAGRELFDRIRVFAEHLARVGDNIRRTSDAYNSAVGSWQSRVLPSGRRIAELGASPQDEEFPVLETVDEVPRSLPETAAPEPLALDSEGNEE